MTQSAKRGRSQLFGETQGENQVSSRFYETVIIEIFRRFQMYKLLSRLILAGAMVIVLPVIYGLLFVFLDESNLIRSDETAFFVTSAIMIPLFVVVWIGIWRGHVVWVSRRKSLTAISVLWSAVVATIAGVCIVRAYPYDKDAAIVLGTACWALVWIVSTALIWRETAAERIARLSLNLSDVVVCLKCRYNMSGLREARCPECGEQYTLNELVGATIVRMDGLGEEL